MSKVVIISMSYLGLREIADSSGEGVITEWLRKESAARAKFRVRMSCLSKIPRTEQLVTQLVDANYRKAFVEAHAKDSIAFQLRMMRKAKDWDQRQLAEHAFGDPKLQSMVSRYENPDYGKYSLNTLLELAAAFDVALVVHFASCSVGTKRRWSEKSFPHRFSGN